MKKTIVRLFTLAIVATAALAITSCNNKKFNVNGHIADAKDSILYFENVSLNGPVVVDSVKLGEDGTFSFTEKANSAPEFYRLRIAGQLINVSVDSTEAITVKASYPTMASQYEITGSENCAKIKELTLLQMGLQQQINVIAKSPALGVTAVEDSVNKVILAYKENIKRNYIYKQPMKAYAYFALFQTVTLGNTEMYIFNTRLSEDDVKVFAAVATSWDTFYPKALRGQNLHNIAIEGMKNVRILRTQQNQSIDASKVNTSGVLDIVLQDNKGVTRKLTDLKGHVVLLDFHAFAGDGSLKRIMMLRELWNKYHAAGFDIYQVSVDTDEHFWETQTTTLPWTCVRADEDSNVLTNYNVHDIPTFFLVNKDGTVYKRDIQIKNLDAEIKSLL